MDAQCKFCKEQEQHALKPQANLTESDKVIAVVVSEVNLTHNMTEWIVGTGQPSILLLVKTTSLSMKEWMMGNKCFLEMLVWLLLLAKGMSY